MLNDNIIKNLMIHDLYTRVWYTAETIPPGDQIKLSGNDGSFRIMQKDYFETYLKDINIKVF